MVTIKIDHRSYQVKKGTTILHAAQSAEIPIPTLCYMEGLNEIGACRLCLVEVKGEDRLVASCNHTVTENMEIFTNTPKVLAARKMNLELLLSQHNTNCPSCIRNGNCQLQTLAHQFHITEETYRKEPTTSSWPKEFPLIRDADKCVKCMRCVQVCDKIQGIHIWDVAGTGSHTTVDVTNNRLITDTGCTLCGQCILQCPTAALHERDDVNRLIGTKGILMNKDLIKIVQIAPAVRAAWGEELGLSPELATVKRLVAALRKIGFDYVFDTNFSADLTVMEEGTEFLTRLSSPVKKNYPMFTSCCPGWVRFLKSRYPELEANLSTAKSPQQMFGAISKTYFAEKMGIPKEQIQCISIMPCIAKKEECDIPSINSSGAEKDVDLAITTRELVRMLQLLQVDVRSLPEEDFDSPLGLGSGAAVIFGYTGGVAEAVLRTCYYWVNGKNPEIGELPTPILRDHWKEITIELGGHHLKLAVVSGLDNTDKLMQSILAGKVNYDLVEVMACPGGCAGGGGQPIHLDTALTLERSDKLRTLDANNQIRFSHENPEIQALYRDFLTQPNSPLAHHLLHTDHSLWDMPEER